MTEPKPSRPAKQPSQPKQPQDPYARRLKSLTSSVQRLRGWTSSDASRRDELVDALVELNAHRLLGHLYRAAAADAQECVRSAVELMLGNGPVGPYTRLEDAIRCGRSMIQLAAVQAGMGLPEAAARSLGSWDQLRAQIAAVDLRPTFDPVTVGLALTGSARGELATGAIGRANAYADAALTRLAESGLRSDPDMASYGLLGIDTDRLASDCRWAAGRGAEAVSFLHRSKTDYDVLVDGRLAQPGRYPPALIERLAEPLFGLYRDQADRLAATGETDLALVVRRDLIETLRGLDGRLPGVPAEISPPVQLVAALTDLTTDLVVAGRPEEARRAADEAVVLADRPGCTGTTRLLAHVARSRLSIAAGRADEVVEPLGQTVSEESEASAAASALALRTLAAAVRIGSGEGHEAGDAEGATAMEQQADELLPGVPTDQLAALARGVVPFGLVPVSWDPLDAVQGYGPAVAAVSAVPSQPADSVRLDAERAEAHRIEQIRLTEARREEQARRSAAEAQAEQAARREAAQRIEAEATARREAEARAAAEQAEQAERKRRREERLREHRRDVEARTAEQHAARRREIEGRITALQAGVVGEAEAREVERLRFELAELAVPAEPQTAAPEIYAPEAEPVAPEPLAPEPVAPEPVTPEPEPAPPEPATTAPPVPVLDEVEAARGVWLQARSEGDRRGARTALEKLIELLRPRAQDDPVRWGLQLRTAWEDLASARLRAGDLFGSRSAAREAKAVSRSLGF